MTKILEVGAPSLNSGDVYTKFDELFKNEKYPLLVKVTNKMPRDCTFPEVPDLFLHNVANQKGVREKQVTIKTPSVFKNLVSSVIQICELNQYPVGLVFEVESDGEESAAEATTVKKRTRTSKPKE